MAVRLNRSGNDLRVPAVARFGHRPAGYRRDVPIIRADDSATAPVADLTMARIRRRKVLGGLIHEYEQAA
jgi:hypothetical protein